MTMNVKETATLQDPITTPVDKRCKPVYCIDNGKRWPSAVACAEQLEVHPQLVRFVCNGRLKTCKKLRLRYEENVAEVRNDMAMEISNKNEKLEEMEAKYLAEKELADKWRAQEAARKVEEERIRKEQEAIRKAEEARLKAIADAEEAQRKAVEKAEKKYNKAKKECFNRQRMVERAEAECQRLVALLVEAEKNRDEAAMNLLIVKGDVKA